MVHIQRWPPKDGFAQAPESSGGRRLFFNLSKSIGKMMNRLKLPRQLFDSMQQADPRVTDNDGSKINTSRCPASGA
jgi:hypothetical protein